VLSLSYFARVEKQAEEIFGLRAQKLEQQHCEREKRKSRRYQVTSPKLLT
jgi:hypothetical protein